MNCRAARITVTACIVAALHPVPSAAQPAVSAFVGFNVIPMTRDTVLRDHTVLVADGKITAVGPANNVRVPRGATRFDGGGRFLLPALADMHTHTTKPRELAMFASYGVLTILNMAWSPDAFVSIERHRYGSGELFGPTVLEARRMNWPYGRTSGISTVVQGRDTVQYAKRIGYEFIKVYSFLTDTVFDAMMQEAASRRITVIGHQTYGIGLGRALRSGMRMVAHAEELGPMVGVPLTSVGADSTVRLFRELGVWLTPTLSTFEAITACWGNPSRLEQYIADAIAAHLPAETAEGWRRNRYHMQTGSVADRLSAYTEITRRLHQAGVPMLAGTDGPGIPGMIPVVRLGRVYSASQLDSIRVAP